MPGVATGVGVRSGGTSRAAEGVPSACRASVGGVGAMLISHSRKAHNTKPQAAKTRTESQTRLLTAVEQLAME